MKKIILSSLIIAASCLALLFSGIYLGLVDFLYYTLFYGLFPVLWGVLLKHFSLKWGHMVLSYFAAGILYGLVAGVFVDYSVDTFLGLAVGCLLVYLFTLPATFVSFAVTKSVCKIEIAKMRKIMIAVACVCAALYVAAVSLIILLCRNL